MFENDPQTKAIVLLGEVGGVMEHAAAAFIETRMNKPVISLIVGRSAPEGAQMGHAGAIIEGEKETAESKMDALKKAGSYIARNPAEIVSFLKKLGV
jgi:succinyl-CoA synthetase alpha subunit